MLKYPHIKDAGWLCYDELSEDLARLARQTSDNVMNGSGLLYVARDRWAND